MKYVILIYDESTADPEAAPPDPEVWAQTMAEYDAYTQALTKAGIHLGGEALQPHPTATTVRIRDGKTMTTDGPFAETHEQFGGFFILECKDLDEAVAWAAKIPTAKYGSIEIRPQWDQ